MAKVIVTREYFVALLDDGGGNALLVETPASMLELGGKEPVLLRLNRRHLPEVATGGDPVLVGDLVRSTTATDSTPKGAVSISIDIEFLGRVAGLSPGARVSQAAKGGASADVVARIARSMLLERPEAADLPGTRWVVADPSDQPALAGKVLTVVSVDVFEAVVEVINTAGEYVDKDRVIPLEWLDTVLTRVEK